MNLMEAFFTATATVHGTEHADSLRGRDFSTPASAWDDVDMPAVWSQLKG